MTKADLPAESIDGRVSPWTAIPERQVKVPRRRRPSLIVGSVGLVLLGAVASIAAVGRSNDRREVVAVTTMISVGQEVSERDLGITELPADTALLEPVAAEDMNEVVGQVAATDLHPGTLLSRSQVTDQRTPAQGEELVALSVEPGRMPARGLAAGDRVLVVETLTDQPVAGQGIDEPVSPGVRATVSDVGEADQNGARTVDVVVPDDSGERLASLAGSGRIALVLLPPGS